LSAKHYFAHSMFGSRIHSCLAALPQRMFSQPITHDQKTSLTSCLLVTQRLKLPGPRNKDPIVPERRWNPPQSCFPPARRGIPLYRHADTVSAFRPRWDRKPYSTALEDFEFVLEKPEWHLNIQTSKRSTTINSKGKNKG